MALIRLGNSLLICLVLLLNSHSIFAEEEVSIAFKDVEIHSVLESVATITGKTFVVDPRVKGRLTIISTEPIRADLLFEVFLSALQVHGFQAVKDGAIYRILPLSQAYRVAAGETGGSLITEVIKLKYSLANNVIGGIRPLLSQGALLQSHLDSNSLIINDSKAQVKRIKSIIAKLDQPKDDYLEIIPLTYIAAAEVMRMASTLKLDKDERLSIVEDDINNRLVIAGPKELRVTLSNLAEQLDVPQHNTANVNVIYLHYLDVKTMKTLIEGMLKSGAFNHITGVKGKDKETKYSIQEEVANNALVIAGSPELVASIRLLVNKLDRPRVQILIEAVIAEVTQDQAKDIGAQLAIASDNGVGVVDFDSALVALGGALLTGSDNSTDTLTTAGTTIARQGLSLGGAILNSNHDRSIALLVQSLQTNTNANILSTPSILTLDNEEASITVGQEVPFLTGSFTSTGTGTANPFQTIERKEVGISLKVTPKVNEGDAVRLTIDQESSNLLPTSAGGGDALQQITAKRTINTNVMIYDGQLLILGGLLDQAENVSRSKVPILGDIPILGHLFKSQRKTQKDNVLMVFIRPTILRSRGEAGDISRHKYKHLRQRQENHNSDKNTIDTQLVGKSLDQLKFDTLKPEITLDPSMEEKESSDSDGTGTPPSHRNVNKVEALP